MKIGTIGFNNGLSNSNIKFQKKKEPDLQQNENNVVVNKTTIDAISKAAYLGALTACLAMATAGCNSTNSSCFSKNPVQQQQNDVQENIQKNNESKKSSETQNTTKKVEPLYNNAIITEEHDENGNVIKRNAINLRKYAEQQEPNIV